MPFFTTLRLDPSERRETLHYGMGGVGDYARTIEAALRESESPSGPVKTLDDMTEEEIAAIERQYNTKVRKG